MIYLDHAATSMHKPPQVYEAVNDAMKRCASLGRSGHHAAVLAADVAYTCRCRAAELFDCRPEQVVFTSNAITGVNAAHIINIATAIITLLLTISDALVLLLFEITSLSIVK